MMTTFRKEEEKDKKNFRSSDSQAPYSTYMSKSIQTVTTLSLAHAPNTVY